MARTHKRVRILGHGRSGTLYTAKVFQMIGLDVGHEEDRKDGAVGPTILRGKEDLASYDVIWQQVRNPLKVIASALTCKTLNFRKTFDQIGFRCSEKDPLRRAMLSWLRYNEWAEKYATFRYQIEAFQDVFPEMLMMLDVPYCPVPASMPTNVNTRPHPELSWEDLYVKGASLTKEIMRKTCEYGYGV